MANEIKRNLLKNPFYTYTEEDAGVEAKNLERKIRFKLKHPSKYESVFEKIIGFMRRMRKAGFRNISVFLKSFEFKPKFIARLANKSDLVLKKIEKKLGETKIKKKSKEHAVEIVSDEDKSALYKTKIKKLKKYDRKILEKNREAEERLGRDLSIDMDVESRLRKKLPKTRDAKQPTFEDRSLLLAATAPDRSRNSKLAALTGSFTATKHKLFNLGDEMSKEQEMFPKRTFLEDNIPFVEMQNNLDHKVEARNHKSEKYPKHIAQKAFEESKIKSDKKASRAGYTLDQATIKIDRNRGKEKERFSSASSDSEHQKK